MFNKHKTPIFTQKIDKDEKFYNIHGQWDYREIEDLSTPLVTMYKISITFLEDNINQTIENVHAVWPRNAIPRNLS